MAGTLNVTLSNGIGKPLSELSMGGDLDPARKLTNELQIKSLPVCNIIPCEMKLGTDVKNFYLDPAWGSAEQGDPSTYLGLLAQHGVTMDARPLQVYFYPESSVTETFSNNYGDSFIASYMKSFGGEGLTDLGQMMGGAGELTKGLANVIGDLSSAGSAISKMMEFVSEHNPLQGTGIGAAIAKAANQAIGGSRFDFPFVWKSSGFNANYSLNIKLFNPDPNSVKSTAENIAGPLCALLCLGLPIGNGAAYSWPFVHIINAPGFFGSKAVGIQNITVTKGGEQNIHSIRTGFVGMVDVRIDFINLFDPMIAGNISGLNYRTSLDDYFDNMITPKNSGGAVASSTANNAPSAEVSKILSSRVSLDLTKISKEASPPVGLGGKFGR